MLSESGRSAAAFNHLWSRYGTRIQASAFALTRHHEDAEDLRQEVFLRVLPRADQFHETSARAYLGRVLRNAAVDRARRLQATPAALSIDVLTEERSADLPEAATDPDAGPEATLLRNEQFRALRQGIRLLPAEERIAVEEHDLQGRSYAEIVQQCGGTEEKWRKCASRGRARLRERLRALHPDLFPPDCAPERST